MIVKCLSIISMHDHGGPMSSPQTPIWRLAALALFGLACASALSGKIAAQEPQNALTLAYRVPDRVTRHEPITLAVVATNEGTEPVTVDFGKNSEGSFQLALSLPGGDLIMIDPRTPRRADEAWTRGVRTLAPRESHTIEIIMSEWADFSDLGVYRLDVRFIGTARRATGGQPVMVRQVSPALTIRVLPRDPDALRRVAEALVRDIQQPIAAPATLAARKLARINDPVVVPYMTRVIEERKGTWVDPWLIPALERIGNDEALQTILRAAGSSDEYTRRSALAALDRMNARGRKP
jgi:hypothetical protein